VLADALPYLRCPVCTGDLSLDESALRCHQGHAFDIARQGYASLLTGKAHTGSADSAAMVAARADFLAGGHFAPLADLVAGLVAERVPDIGCVLDAGAGTGHYLAAVLDRLPGRPGIALDLSKHALRRAARAHPRIAALTWDVWRTFPLRTGTVAALLDVFAPRNAAEFHRVLRPDGILIIVTPTARHLAELVETLDLLTVDPRKADRIAETVGDRFALAGTWPLETRMRLTHAEAETLVGMGPSAWHTDPAAIRARIAGLADPIVVTAAVEVRVFDVRPES
jgi:23S rRNA (guanine745-N1)-methyltransferase